MKQNNTPYEESLEDENDLEFAFVKLDNLSAYFCVIQMEVLSVFDDLEIENILSCEILEDKEMKNSNLMSDENFNSYRNSETSNSKKIGLKENLNTPSISCLIEYLITNNPNQELMFFELSFTNGLILNYYGELSLQFKDLNSLEKYCMLILKKTGFDTTETFDKLAEIGDYCFINNPSAVLKINYFDGKIEDFENDTSF
jgi:hypothetical protein